MEANKYYKVKDITLVAKAVGAVAAGVGAVVTGAVSVSKGVKYFCKKKPAATIEEVPVPDTKEVETIETSEETEKEIESDGQEQTD